MRCELAQATRSSAKGPKMRLNSQKWTHAVPKIYVLIAEIFQLPESTSETEIIDNLARGLSSALNQFPILAGSLQIDETNGRLCVTKSKASTVAFCVNSMDDTNDDFPSFDYLDERDFLIHLFTITSSCLNRLRRSSSFIHSAKMRTRTFPSQPSR